MEPDDGFDLRIFTAKNFARTAVALIVIVLLMGIVQTIEGVFA